ncbi:MAG: hypothetical protein BAJALOKI2v1_1020003 [Promethearchaeota archaeon]|nr:MAG: hypothetical protein BAJALOKI2v1_1020003 [Candidatus Lokiarchaeota archaeon]
MSKEEDFLDYANYHNISDFANFSIKDIIALQFLVRYREPIVRHLLYTEVKQFIEFKEEPSEIKDISESPRYEKKFYNFVRDEKQLYPPSFYNMLGNLEEKGLIEFLESDSGKIPNIQATPYTNYVPLLLLKFLINNNVMVSEEFREEFSKKFLEKLKNKQFNRILSIWFSEYVMIPIIKLLSTYSKEQYILPKKGSNDILNGTNIKNVKLTEMISNHISVPEEIFDGVIIPVYKKNPKFFNMKRTEILQEVARVIDSGGSIILVAIAKIRFTKNIFLDDLIKLYNLSLNNRIFSEEELKNDMEKVGFSDIEIFEHQGLLLGIGKKE